MHQYSLNSFLKSCLHAVFLQLPNPLSGGLFVLHYFLLSMSVTASQCCNSQGMTFTCFKSLLLFLPTNTKSILVSFPPILYVIFSTSSFQTMYLAHTTPFHHKIFVVVFPQHSSSPIPATHTFKAINPSPNISVEVPRPRIISPGFCKSHSLAMSS